MTAASPTLRRIVTSTAASGRSTILIDGPPATGGDTPARTGLLEIWREHIRGVLDPEVALDSFPAQLSPDDDTMLARWFVVEPLPEGIPQAKLVAAARAQFDALHASDALADQARHAFMHRTATLDVVVLLEGDASLVLDDTETRLRPGDVVIQRGAAHAWVAHGGPAVFLAVMIARSGTPSLVDAPGPNTSSAP